MSPEWIPLLFAAAVIVLLLVVLRPRAQSWRTTICRLAVMEAVYLGMAYLLLDVLFLLLGPLAVGLSESRAGMCFPEGDLRVELFDLLFIQPNRLLKV